MQSPLINVMSAAAIKAGKGLMRDFGEVDNLQVSRKSASNFVTASDTRTEKLLHRELENARPGYSFLMEEGGEIKGEKPEYRWIIDPLDGTHNFIHAIPYFCISIGLERTQRNGQSEIIAGVIFDPIHNELFFAELGKGAFMNNRKLNVSIRDNMEECLIVTNNPRQQSGNVNYGKTLETLTRSGASLRYFGATALDLAYLAAGRVDACWHYTIQPWDIAAGLLLVREAGGLVSQLNGERATPYSTNLLACNQLLSPQVQKLLA